MEARRPSCASCAPRKNQRSAARYRRWSSPQQALTAAVSPPGDEGIDASTSRIPSPGVRGNRRAPSITRQPPSPLAIRSMPTCAHAASLSPPGAPETPISTTISSPALIGSAPSAEVTLSRCSAPAPVDEDVTRLPNSPEGVRNVREVYTLRRLFSRVCGFAPSSCSTTTVRVARFSTVTVTLYPSLRHCSRAPIAASCAALNDRVRSVTSAGKVAAVCAWATGGTRARVAAKTSHLLPAIGSSFFYYRGLTNGDTSPQAPWKTKASQGLRVRGASSRCCRSSGKVVVSPGYPSTMPATGSKSSGTPYSSLTLSG